MIAIRLTQANFHRILNESPIPVPDLRAMMEEYDTPHRELALFFVPQSDIAHDLAPNSWMTIPKKYLDENYEYDNGKIDHQFVPLTHK